MGPGAILQDDNATPHCVRVVTGFLQQHQVTQMDWPARSPYSVDILDRRVHDNHPPAANLTQLFQFLQQEWNVILQQTLVTLVQSMRKRCVECLMENGGFTHY